MITAADAVYKARELIGTPYSSLDCINLVVKVIRTAPGGVKNYRTAGTDTLWASGSSGTSKKYKDLTWRQEGISGAVPGMLAFKGRATDKKGDGQPHHVGIVSRKGNELTVIHSSSVKGEVVETPLNGNGWTLLACHRYIETEDENSNVLNDPLSDAYGHTGGESVEIDTMYEAIVTTKKTDLNLRCGPGVGYKIIGSIPKGAIVEILEEHNNGWDHVRWNGIIGYVSAEYLSPGTPTVTVEQQAEQGGSFKNPNDEIKEAKAEARAESYGVFIPCDNEAEAVRYAGNIKKAVIVRFEKPPDTVEEDD